MKRFIGGQLIESSSLALLLLLLYSMLRLIQQTLVQELGPDALEQLHLIDSWQLEYQTT